MFFLLLFLGGGVTLICRRRCRRRRTRRAPQFRDRKICLEHIYTRTNRKYCSASNTKKKNISNTQQQQQYSSSSSSIALHKTYILRVVDALSPGDISILKPHNSVYLRNVYVYMLSMSRFLLLLLFFDCFVLFPDEYLSRSAYCIQNLLLILCLRECI